MQVPKAIVSYCFNFEALKMDSFWLARLSLPRFCLITFQVLTALWEIICQPEKLVFHGKNQAFHGETCESNLRNDVILLLSLKINQSTSGPWNCRCFFSGEKFSVRINHLKRRGPPLGYKVVITPANPCKPYLTMVVNGYN